MPDLAINGGPKACGVKWPDWPMWDQKERKALLGVLDSGKWWYGEKVQEFERKFADFQDAKYAVSTNTGCAAIEAGMLALGIQAGDEVIVPPYTFMATALAVVRCNAIPVFADIQGDTLNLDPDDVERKITPRTKGILPVHLGGYVADMDRLNAIASKRKLWVLEDACHSWGSKWKGKGTGALGNGGAFSFQNSKNITSSEGGILLTDDEALAETVRSYTNCGRVIGKAWYYHDIAGANLRMTEFQAAILLAQLGRLESQTKKREAAGKILDDGLAEIPGISVVKAEPRMTRRAYHLYTFRLDPKVLGVSREKFMAALTAEGVPCSPGYTTPLYRYNFFNQKPNDDRRGCKPWAAGQVDYGRVSCPVCEEVCATTLWFKHAMLLAGAPAMRTIVKAVRKVCENTKELK